MFINDLDNDSVDTQITEYDKLLKILHLRTPNSTIYISSILERKELSMSNETKDLNDRLAKLQGSFHFTFINHANINSDLMFTFISHANINSDLMFTFISHANINSDLMFTFIVMQISTVI